MHPGLAEITKLQISILQENICLALDTSVDNELWISYFSITQPFI